MTENSIITAIERYSDMVFRLAYARTLNYYDAEDVYQEVFLRLAGKNPDFKSEEHRKAWLINLSCWSIPDYKGRHLHPHLQICILRRLHK